MYNATIVIPTYNRELLLRYTLQTILNQETMGYTFEVIVVDDGSTDQTSKVVDEFKNQIPNLRYYYQEHDGFGAARARNVGIANARGEIIIFIDSGILLSKRFVYQHCLSHGAKNACAVIGNVYAFTALTDDTYLLNLLDLDNIDKSIASLKKEEKYIDVRCASYRNFDFRIENAPAPYFYFWTSNVSVRKQDLLEVGGFDENFRTWGMEDVDLGFKLYKNNICFTLNLDAEAIHYPHDSKNDSESKKDTDKENLRYFHNKHKCIESEMLLCGREFFYNEALIHLFSNESNRFNFGILSSKSIMHGNESAPTLIIGGHNGKITEKFRNSLLLEYNTDNINKIKEEYPDCEAYLCLGGKTDFKDNQFEQVLITDFWRFLNKAWLASIFAESTRVGNNVYMLYQVYIDGVQQLNLDEKQLTMLKNAATKAKVVYSTIKYVDENTVFEYLVIKRNA